MPHLTQMKEALLAREAECQMERKLERESRFISYECWASAAKHLLLSSGCCVVGSCLTGHDVAQAKLTRETDTEAKHHGVRQGGTRWLLNSHRHAGEQGTPIQRNKQQAKEKVDIISRKAFSTEQAKLYRPAT